MLLFSFNALLPTLYVSELLTIKGVTITEGVCLFISWNLAIIHSYGLFWDCNPPVACTGMRGEDVDGLVTPWWPGHPQGFFFGSDHPIKELSIGSQLWGRGHSHRSWPWTSPQLGTPLIVLKIVSLSYCQQMKTLIRNVLSVCLFFSLSFLKYTTMTSHL